MSWIRENHREAIIGKQGSQGCEMAREKRFPAEIPEMDQQLFQKCSVRYTNKFASAWLANVTSSIGDRRVKILACASILANPSFAPGVRSEGFATGQNENWAAGQVGVNTEKQLCLEVWRLATLPEQKKTCIAHLKKTLGTPRYLGTYGRTSS